MFTLSCNKRTKKCKRHMNWCVIYWWDCFCECYWQHLSALHGSFTRSCVYFSSLMSQRASKKITDFELFSRRLQQALKYQKIMTNSQKPPKWGLLCTMEGLVTVWFLHLPCWKDCDNSVLTTLHRRFLVRFLNLAVHDQQMDLIV